MVGVLVNAGLVILGGTIGMLANKVLKKEWTDFMMKAMALCVLYVGISGCLNGEEMLVTIISMAIGALIGTIVGIDDKFSRLVERIEDKVRKGRKAEGPTVSEGFIAASLLFCTGAMTVVGSLDAGLLGDNSTLIAKGAIDCVSALVLASTLGVGVPLSSIFIIVFQGGIVLLSSLLEPLLTPFCISEITCVGSLLIIGISFNMFGFTKLKIMDLMPAVFMPLIICPIFSLFSLNV